MSRLCDNDPTVRKNAVHALAGADVDRDDLPAELQAALSSQEWGVRAGALATLKTLKLPAHLALPPCIEALSYDDADVTSASLSTIRSLGEAGIPALSAIVGLLEGEESARVRFVLPWQARSVQSEALETLRGLGHNAKAALPTLRRLATREEPYIRLASVRAIDAMGPEATREALAEMRDVLSADVTAHGILDALELAEARLETAESILRLNPPDPDASLDALLSIWGVYWYLAGRQPDVMDEDIDKSEGWHPSFDSTWEEEKWMEEHGIEAKCAELADSAVEFLNQEAPWPELAMMAKTVWPRLLAELNSSDLGVRWRARIMLDAMTPSDETTEADVAAALRRDKERIKEASDLRREASARARAAKEVERRSDPAESRNSSID